MKSLVLRPIKRECLNPSVAVVIGRMPGVCVCVCVCESERERARESERERAREREIFQEALRGFGQFGIRPQVTGNLSLFHSPSLLPFHCSHLLLFICYSSDISPTIFTLLHYSLLYPFSPPSIHPPPCPKFSPSLHSIMVSFVLSSSSSSSSSSPLPLYLSVLPLSLSLSTSMATEISHHANSLL